MLSYQLILLLITVFQLNLIQIEAIDKRIYFPDEDKLTVGSTCSLSSTQKGNCTLLSDCPEMGSSDFDTVMLCSYEFKAIIICCPVKDQSALLHQSLTTTSTTTTSTTTVATTSTAASPIETKIAPPMLYWLEKWVRCGITWELDRYSAGIEINEEWEPIDDIYYLNKTADQLRSKGYDIEILEMYYDAIVNMTLTNGTYTQNLGYDWYGPEFFVIGGRDAPAEMALFMALLGHRDGNETTWLCDGVVLNRQWILTAAHCFLERISPNVVRLGDYDWKRENESELEFLQHFIPVDMGIADIILHPEFKVDQRYHDIALIKLEKPYPLFAPNINPVCLPWHNSTNLDIVGYNVTLAGWGTTEYTGAAFTKHNILQAVNLTVFDTTVCDSSYSQLFDYRFKWPQGMTPEKTLCVGWEEGGRDACKGDSGGPLAYIDEESGLYTLAGIVSGGFGCGKIEYPGLYTPINRANYLSWIKEVAFGDFIDSVGTDYADKPFCWTSPTERKEGCETIEDSWG